MKPASVIGKNDMIEQKVEKSYQQNPSFDEQLDVFISLGYKLNAGITKELILKEVSQIIWDTTSPEEEFQKRPFTLLYYLLGWRNSDIGAYNFTENCIWFDLEFFDPSSQYGWFMKRMGAISDGEIKFENIRIDTDDYGVEWIAFEANGIPKRWKLEKQGYISDSFIQRFAYLPKELKTKGRYTYFDDGSQQFVIDYASENQQKEFIQKTSLKREWLGEGNHFTDPKE